LLPAFHKTWDGVHIYDLHGNLRVFNDTDPFVHMHIANTFENESGIVMDVATYSDLPLSKDVLGTAESLNKTLRDSKPLSLRAQVRRYHFNFLTGLTGVQNLTQAGKDYDFLKVNPAYAGLEYCIYYAVEWFHNDRDFASMAIVKHDICRGEVRYWSRPNTYVNEPFFVARAASSSREDDGAVVFAANDGNTGKAVFVMLDAESFEELLRVPLERHIPFTGHGSFVPAGEDTIVV